MLKKILERVKKLFTFILCLFHYGPDPVNLPDPSDKFEEGHTFEDKP
jgi:hypothetical protein